MREHNNYWYLTEIYNLENPKPGFNGEPYYAGYKDNRGPGSVKLYQSVLMEAQNVITLLFVRVCMAVFCQED